MQYAGILCERLRIQSDKSRPCITASLNYKSHFESTEIGCSCGLYRFLSLAKQDPDNQGV